jgi:hypothetical protein
VTKRGRLWEAGSKVRCSPDIGVRTDCRCEDAQYIEESDQYMGGSRGDLESRGRGHYAHHEVSR